MGKSSELTGLGLLIALIALVFVACGEDGIQLPEIPTRDQGAPPAEEQPPVEEQPPPVEEQPPAEEPPPVEPVDPSTGTAPVEDGDGSDVPWKAILIGGGIVVLLLLVVGSWLGRRSAASTEQVAWRDRALAAASAGAAIHDSLALQPVSGTGAGASGVEQERWRDTERRMNDLAVQLHGLEDGQPASTTAELTARLLGALNTLRFAMQSHVSARTQETPVALQIEESAALMRRRLSEFDAALIAFKARI